VARWLEFAATNDQLASFVEERLKRAPCYFATVREDAWPRVHPVGPLVLRNGALCASMYPTSPKCHDVRRTGQYALHCAVENGVGGAGEVLVTTYDELGMNPTRTRWRAGMS